MTAAPGETATADIPLAARAFQVWDEEAADWAATPGRYLLHASRNATEDLLTTELTVTRHQS